MTQYKNPAPDFYPTGDDSDSVTLPHAERPFFSKLHCISNDDPDSPYKPPTSEWYRHQMARDQVFPSGR